MVPGRKPLFYETYYSLCWCVTNSDESMAAISFYIPKYPLTFHFMTPLIFPFPELAFINFDHFILSSCYLWFALDEGQYDFPAELKQVTCSVLIYVVFCLCCMWWHICIMSCVKSIISSNVSLVLVNHEKRLSVALHLSPLFLFLHFQRCLSVTLSPLQRHILLPHFGHDPSLCNSVQLYHHSSD